MRNVMSPGHPVFPVLRLQRDAVSGSSSLSDPDFELHSLLTHALSQTHLTRLQGGGGEGKDGSVDVKRWTGQQLENNGRK